MVHLSPLRIGALSALLAAPAFAQEVETIVIPQLVPQMSPGDRLGSGVDVDGSIAVVGAPFDSDPVGASGAVHVVDLETGLPLAKLLNPSPGFLDQLGQSVAISGDVVVACTEWGFIDDGAYVFDLVTGLAQHLLVPTTAGVPQDFGEALAVDGNLVLVGDRFWRKDLIDSNSYGSAFLFDANTGAQLFELVGSLDPDMEWFGDDVDVAGSRCVVGAPRSDFGGAERGAAYLFDTTTGAQVAALADPDPQDGAMFGTAVAIGDGFVAVSAPLAKNTAGEAVGAVHVYDAANGAFVHTLVGSVAQDAGAFGNDLSIDARRVAVGAPGHDVGGVLSAGAISVFDLDTGAELFTLVEHFPRTNGRLGLVLALSADRIVHGNENDDSLLDNGGCLRSLEFPVRLATSTTSISLAAGGAQTFQLTSGPSQAGNAYAILGSLSPNPLGTPTGTGPFDPLFPLVVDGFTAWNLASLGVNPLYAGQLGQLDAQGRATAAFGVPAGTSPALAGTHIFHAALVIDPSPSIWTALLDRCSNAVALRLLP